MLNIITYAALYISGIYVGVFIPTLIENSSKGFRQLIRRITNYVHYDVRRAIMFAMLFLMALFGYFVMNLSVTLNGIISGLIAGFFVYLRAGVTLGDYQPSEKNIFFSNANKEVNSNRNGKAGKNAKGGKGRKNQNMNTSKKSKKEEPAPVKKVRPKKLGK